MRRPFTAFPRPFAAALTLTLVAAASITALVSSGSAAPAAPPNTAPPTITGTAREGETLTADPGTWTGTQITFTYEWQRCTAAGAGCAAISGAAAKTYVVAKADIGATLRVKVTATDTTGSTSATSAPTALVAGPATGCPSGTGTANVKDVSPPARLVIDQYQVTPTTVTRSTGNVTARFHVVDTCGHAVEGALVYVTGVPYNQFSIAPEQATGADGWAQLEMRQLSGFPAARRQQLLVLFARARKPGDKLLAGIATRRLVSTPVSLSS